MAVACEGATLIPRPKIDKIPESIVFPKHKAVRSAGTSPAVGSVPQAVGLHINLVPIPMAWDRGTSWHLAGMSYFLSHPMQRPTKHPQHGPGNAGQSLVKTRRRQQGLLLLEAVGVQS